MQNKKLKKIKLKKNIRINWDVEIFQREIVVIATVIIF